MVGLLRGRKPGLVSRPALKLFFYRYVYHVQTLTDYTPEFRIIRVDRYSCAIL